MSSRFKLTLFIFAICGLFFPVFAGGYWSGDGSINSTVEINASTTNGPVLEVSDYYGQAVANIGDLNDDGVSDILVGAYQADTGYVAAGEAHIHFMNASGSIKLPTVAINSSTPNGPTLNANYGYGTSVVGIGDLDRDGVEDIAVGAWGDRATGSYTGGLHISFMNTDGSVDATTLINGDTTNGPTLDEFDYYGLAAANIGDLNGDGVTDIAVGAPWDNGGGSHRGAVHIHFMRATRSENVLSTVELNETTTNGPSLVDSDWYGRSVAGLGDLDGDGVIDLAVGAHNDDAGGTNRGTVYIHFMNSDGSIKSSTEINSTTDNGPSVEDSDNYGVSVANLGDLNGDGVTDLAVGARYYGVAGSLYIHFLNTDGSVDSTVRLDGSTVNGASLSASDNYGESVASIGDLNGDGVSDLAVGAVYDDGDDTGTNYGALHIHFMHGDWVEIDKTVTDKRPKRTGDRCYCEEPPALTWVTLEPLTVGDVLGMQVNWTQYGANEMTIKIDDGTGSYPWQLEKISNDGHEFLPNVQTWQNIKIKPINHCNSGDYSIPVSYSAYPGGLYNE